LLLAVSSGVAAVAAWDLPTSEKFKPLLSACEGIEAFQNCSSSFMGVCQTYPDGVRACADPPEHHCFWGIMTALKHRQGFHRQGWYGQGSHRHEGGHDTGRGGPWVPTYLGDCASKQDGQACTFHRAGRCLPSGKCPVFRGHMVCKPWDSHPPGFVTKPCEDKQAGDACFYGLVAGRCKKAKTESSLRCFAGPFRSRTASLNASSPEKSAMIRQGAEPTSISVPEALADATLTTIAPKLASASTAPGPSADALTLDAEALDAEALPAAHSNAETSDAEALDEGKQHVMV